MRLNLTVFVIMIILCAACGTSRQAIEPVKTNTVKNPVKLSDTELKRKYASQLNVERKYIYPVDLYRYVDSWIGTPYRLGGKDRSGIDCSAFVQNIYRDVYGYQVARTTKDLLELSRRFKKTKKLNHGDLVFFRTGKKAKVNHVGVYLINGYFAHASLSKGVMISHLNEDYWKKAFYTAGKMQ